MYLDAFVYNLNVIL